jgi:tryptophan synthase alpha chain
VSASTAPGFAAGETTPSGVERIAAAFARAREEGRAALMPYLMGGFPTLEESLRVGQACVAAGADVLELGVPYSDPLADGPVIHDAATRALAGGATLTGVLEVARALAPSVPVVLMCYSNMVFAPGAQAFVELLARTGASGLIVPDLPYEEADEALAACDAHGIALVPLVAPTTTDERFARIGARARGFLYTVSVVGTTGERSALSERFAEIVARAKACTAVPVALGFGISTPEQARQAAVAGADGVIVGTRLVRAAGESDGDPAAAVGEVVAELAGALRPTLL